MTEQELISGCLRENTRCQQELFQRYAGILMTICRRYARHQAEAEDFLQDTFINIFNNMYQYKNTGSFEGWMKKICVNIALKKVQKSAFKKELFAIDDFHYEQIDEHNALDQLQEEELLQLIAKLPDGYRLVFNLYVLEGYSHHEISELLKIQESTSRSQLLKARKQLQQQLLTRQIVRV